MSKVFGQRLKECRIEKGYTQQNIADLFNVSKMTISAWENDKQEPSITDILKLATLLNITTDYLLGKVDETGKPNDFEEFVYADGAYRISRKKTK